MRKISFPHISIIHLRQFVMIRMACLGKELGKCLSATLWKSENVHDEITLENDDLWLGVGEFFIR